MEKFHGYFVAATLAALVATSPVLAQNPAPKDNMPEKAEKALTEGIKTVLRALETMFESIPQYEMPEVLENGDIIIRRKHPKKDKPPDDTGAT